MTDTTESLDVLTHQTADGHAELTWPAVPEAEHYEIQPLGSVDGRTVVPADQNRIEVPRARDGYQITALRGAIPLQTYVSIDDASADEPADMDDYVSRLQGWTGIATQYEKTTRTREGEPVTTEETVGGRTWVVTTQKYTLAKTPKYVVLASTANQAIWPGALIQGGPAAKGRLAELVINKRRPLTISTDLTSLPKTCVDDVRASRSSVATAIASMVRGQDAVAGGVYYKIEEASTVQSGLLEADISASYMGAGGDVNAKVEKKYEEKIILACFLQNVFSMSIDGFGMPSECFTSDLTNRDIKTMERLGRIGENNPPLYVSSVGYGRSLIFALTTTADTTKAKAAVKASYEGFGASVKAEVKAEYEEILNQSSLTIIAQGGDAGSITDMIRTGRLKEYFVKPPKLDQYVPISYALNSLATDELAKLGETAEYNAVSRAPKDTTSWMFRPISLRFTWRNSGDFKPDYSGPAHLRFDESHKTKGIKRDGDITTFGDDVAWKWTPGSRKGDQVLRLGVEAKDSDYGTPIDLRITEQQLHDGGKFNTGGTFVAGHTHALWELEYSLTPAWQ
jgi:hypothetical protein